MRDAHLSLVALRHLGRIGLDVVRAIEAPDDETHLRCRGVAERHRRGRRSSPPPVRFQPSLHDETIIARAGVIDRVLAGVGARKDLDFTVAVIVEFLDSPLIGNLAVFEN
jgi:hypothetical protein